MPQPNQPQKEKDEKLEYLKRDEIKTMTKDVGRLREAEARQERQRVAQMRIEEERKTETTRLETASKDAEKRSEAAKADRQREEETIELREERMERQKAEEIEAAKQMEQRKTALSEQMQKVQGAEEQARRSFLERVEAKAEDKEVKEAPKPRIPVPEIPKPTMPQAPPRIPVSPALAARPLAARPARFPWTQLVIALFSLAVLGAVATFWYWYFEVRSEVQIEQPAEEPEKPLIKQEAAKPKINEILLDFGYRIPDAPRVIDAIIIHTVYNALGRDPHRLESILEEYRIYGVAAHYLISRDGAIYQTAPDEAIAFHAGTSQMPDGRTSVNNFSIGIEIVNGENDYSPTSAQYESLASLVRYLRQEYNISSANILGHNDISPERKTDPWNFDWQYFNSLINP